MRLYKKRDCNGNKATRGEEYEIKIVYPAMDDEVVGFIRSKDPFNFVHIPLGSEIEIGSSTYTLVKPVDLRPAHCLRDETDTYWSLADRKGAHAKLTRLGRRSLRDYLMDKLF